MEAPQNGADENVGLLVLEPKSFRPFKTKDEYLYAMKEDLAEWFKCLYEDRVINADTFLEVLETGVLLCQHANKVRSFASEQKTKGDFSIQSNFVRDIQIPEYDVQFRVDVKPGTFLARDNISNFITWTARMGISEVLRFETDDLVMRKNERSVVLCLLEVARVGARFGMLAPTIVQMEEEIEKEIQTAETGKPPPQIVTCDIRSLDEMVRELVGRCSCPVQFPIIKVGEGKYKIGDNQTLVFVRILRKHVMIRVGGGWDTLENYLDRHDPCRCGFKGHRGGRAPSTPRRTSTTSVSQSMPNTPKSPRKMSLQHTTTQQNNAKHSRNTPRPASPSMRSASPGPTAQRKLNLAVKNSNSQPGSSVTSPSITNKQITFQSAGLNNSGKQNVQTSGLNNSGSFSVGNFVKEAQANLTRQLSSDSNNTQAFPTPYRSASPALRAPSPALRRSESPTPTVANRLRSPSPAPSNVNNPKGTRTQSVPAQHTGRCSSPIKQITLSELRSSRDGKLTPAPSQQQSNQTPQKATQPQNQASRDKTGSDDPNMDSNNPSLTIDKISTMSLGEFKNLLNNALSVPNGTADSQCSSDSPRSQGSVESSRTIQNKKSKSTPYKSPYSFRPSSVNSNKNSTAKSSINTPSKSGVMNVKSSLDYSSSGYSSSSMSSDKQTKSHMNANKQSVNRPRTPSGSQVNGVVSNRQSSTRNVSNSSAYQGHSNTSLNSTDSISRSRSNASSVSDTSYTLPARGTYASRSSSHSSLRSFESMDIPYEDRNGDIETESGDDLTRVPLTPSSCTSDYSFTNGGTHLDSTGYSRSNSYTPCAAAEDKAKWDRLQTNSTRASSEPKETVGNLYTNGHDVPESKPLNVGYAYAFSYQDENQDSNELNEIENTIQNSKTSLSSADNSERSLQTPKNDTYASKQIPRSHTPTGRATPSLIPRPMTPKISRKMSIPHSEDTISVPKEEEKHSAARPPTPRKSNIIARAHGQNTSVRGADSSREKSYREIFQKRSMTPGPGSGSSVASMTNNARRAITPGPILQKSSLSNTSATTTRARLNESLNQTANNKKQDMPLSVYNDNTRNSQTSERSGRTSSRTFGGQRSQSVDRRTLTKQKSVDQEETVIMVNREGGHHTLSVQNENDPDTKTVTQKHKVLARARTEDKTRTQPRVSPAITRQRPQSVEPRQLAPRKKSTTETVLTVKRTENGGHAVYDRTQEWVATAVEQTQVKKTKPKPARTVNPRMRRCMTPNSFDMRIDMEPEEPRTLEEIKAALTLPINGLTNLNADKIEAPPEDPEMYMTMEKMFNELRQQELKASVNETPGSSTNGFKPTKTMSKSSGSINDEEMSLDSNKNIKRKTPSVSSKSSSNVTSPALSRPNRTSISSNNSTTSKSIKPQSMSRTSSTSSASAQSTNHSTPSRTNQYPARPASPRTTPPRAVNPPRPSSPRTTVSSQRPPSPRTTPPAPRPTPSRVMSHNTRPVSPRTTAPAPRPASPMNRQPPRPSSTPPREIYKINQNTRASDDVDAAFEPPHKTSTSLLSKLKEIIKVKPRKDKADTNNKPKSRIPAPKSLAKTGKSLSFSNLSNLSNSMSLVHSDSLNNTYDEPEMSNGHDYSYTDQINGGLNVTISGRSETPAPKMIKAITTGRSSLIRKESMDKIKGEHKIARTVSNNSFKYFENENEHEGEYV